MLNTYDFNIAHPDVFKQLSVRDLLFLYYKCPQFDKQLQLHSHYNLITFTLGGSRNFYQAGKKYTADENSTYFVRKTAYIQDCLRLQNGNCWHFIFPMIF